jgi:hypothetical protein
MVSALFFSKRLGELHEAPMVTTWLNVEQYTASAAGITKSIKCSAAKSRRQALDSQFGFVKSAVNR